MLLHFFRGWVDFLLHLPLELRSRFERTTFQFLLEEKVQIERKKRKNLSGVGEINVLNMLGFSKKGCIIEAVRTGDRYGSVI